MQDSDANLASQDAMTSNNPSDPRVEERIGDGVTSNSADDIEGSEISLDTSPSGPEVPPQSEPGFSGEGSAFSELIGAEDLTTKSLDVFQWIQENLLVPGVAIQLVIILSALIPAAFFGPRIKKLISSRIAPLAPYGLLRRGANAFAHIATPIALYLILQSAVIALDSMDRSKIFVEAGVSLLTAWIVIRLVTLVIRSPFWSKVAFYIAWPIAALDAFGFLDDVARQLDAAAFQIGTSVAGEPEMFSALDGVRTLVIFGALFWVANFVNQFLKTRLNAVDELTPSLQALLTKILDILVPVIALLIALQVVGFNLATLTIFGGAVGLGIGLGLQRTISNFFAGFTLIADKSIKPGDVIEIGDTFGWVTQMNARYVAVRTRDGTSHLLPNDKFIEDGVINWSHQDKIVRLHVQFGVSYNTRDLRGIKKMAEEEVIKIDRVLKTPAPKCNLIEFGDSSVNFDLRLWINDPANGVSNVKSLVMLAIWDQLHEMGVEIPFPQRDLHLRSIDKDVNLKQYFSGEKPASEIE